VACLWRCCKVWRFSGAVQRNYPQFTESRAIIFPYFSHLRISIEVSQVKRPFKKDPASKGPLWLNTRVCSSNHVQGVGILSTFASRVCRQWSRRHFLRFNRCKVCSTFNERWLVEHVLARENLLYVHGDCLTQEITLWQSKRCTMGSLTWILHYAAIVSCKFSWLKIFGMLYVAQDLWKGIVCGNKHISCHSNLQQCR